MQLPKVVSVTGHRELTPVGRQRIWVVMERLLQNDTIREVWFGGARGTDTEALLAALHHRGSNIFPRFVVVVPNQIANQPKECWESIHRADRVIELGIPIQKEDGWAAFQRRNEYLVDEASTLLAFWNGEKSGTGNTVAYAKKKGVQVRVIDM